ncbi:MAG: response regulator [Treponema sp.]|jgi:signal transduction histidine kinase/CheY-like chemotaxis protein|nr:response regulator [Treponema sp.]
MKTGNAAFFPRFLRVLKTIVLPVCFLFIVLFLLFHRMTRRPAKDAGLYINLQNYPFYLKSGFDRARAADLPDLVAEKWITMAVTPDKPSAVKIKKSGLEDLPKRGFLSPLRGKDREFTVKILFPVDASDMKLLQDETPFTPGIFFASIGDNWEIFLNGVPVKAELHLDAEGQIVSHRSYHHVSFPVRRSLFKLGTNLLTVRIIGDPSYENTGFFVVSPYYIGDMESIATEHDESLVIALCGIYIFLGVYHLILFFIRPEARYNLFYCLFSSFLGGYFLIRSAAIFKLIPDTGILLRLDMGILFMTIPLLAAFAEELNFKKTLLQTRVCLAFFFLLALLQTCFSPQFSEDILKIWQVSAILEVLYIFGCDFLYAFFANARAIRGKAEEEGRNISLPGSWGLTIIDTPIGNLMIGILILLLTGLFDILDAMALHNNLFISRYGFFVFTVGAAFVLAREFGYLYRRLNQANAALEMSNTNLEATVRKRTHELEVQTLVAESASRAKTEFLARMSHEIRTPLNAIIGLADVELRKNPPGEAGEHLEEIRGSGSLLLSIINELLDISKIESGRFELAPVEYDPLELLRESIKANRVRISSRPIEFVTDISPSLPGRLYGDEIRVKQILNNLLSNACKYTNEGKITLRVWGEAEDGAFSLFLSVEDTGRGLREEQLPRLFSEYQRFDEQAGRNIEGTGLGLSITKKLVELMDGRITVESTYGKGSLFTVSIHQKIVEESTPVGEAASALWDSESRDETRKKPEALEYFRLPDARILMVDDMLINIRVLQALLSPYQMIVSGATSGEQAIKMIRKADPQFDLIFMDHMMPGMDGIETVRIIRNEIVGEYAKTVPIIALTANALTGNDKMFLENGFQGFLSKPINTALLDVTLRTWLLGKG